MYDFLFWSNRQTESSQRVHIDGVGALDIETHSRGFFDHRIDWKGQKRSKMTGSRRATDLIEHYDAFFLILHPFPVLGLVF